MAIEVQRDVLARMLRSHGEAELAERALASSDDQLARIGTLGGYYAFSEDAMALGGSMGTARALSLATIDVLDRIGRDLHRHHTQHEVERGISDEPDADDRNRDRELRRHASTRQVPADQSKRILDILDPPAWGPQPPDAAPVITRCHELRTKPLKDFTVEDLRIMIEQQIAPNHLVGMALTRLRADPLLRGNRFAGDLLASVLRVDPAYWEPRLDPEVSARILAEKLRERTDLEPELRELIKTFIRDHPPRSAVDFPD